MEPFDSRPTSILSHANSVYSQAGSTRHILAGTLEHPISAAPHSSSAHTPFLHAPQRDSSSVSLSVNYVPSKFSSGIVSPGGPRKRKGGPVDLMVPKFGGGVDAFRSGEQRIGGEDDDNTGLRAGSKHKGQKKGRWNKFKWILFFANTLLSGYSLAGLIVCLLTWFDVYSDADIIRVGNYTELVLSTTAAAFGIFASLMGWAGLLLNNRTFLGVYTALLWVVFIFLVAPGYITFKKRNFNLEGKVNSQWSRDLGAAGRMRIQNKLMCCGYFSPFVGATVTQTCYSRSILPGCKLDYMLFERRILRSWYTIIFSIVPAQIFVMVTAILCSNHVTYRFGKGMMPKRYRLSLSSMAVIMDNYASQLAQQYGSDVASEVLARSKSTLNLNPQK